MIKCNRGCGATHLRWKVINGHYKLFNHNDLLHICNDGVEADQDKLEHATATILAELGLSEPAQIPEADIYIPKKDISKSKQVDDNHGEFDPAKMFTITGTASGLAITVISVLEKNLISVAAVIQPAVPPPTTIIFLYMKI